MFEEINEDEKLPSICDDFLNSAQPIVTEKNFDETCNNVRQSNSEITIIGSRKVVKL